MDARKIHSQLTEIIHNTQGVLLDFDGPVCSVFAGVSASSVAARLRTFALDQGVSLPLDVIEEDDPLHVLRRVNDLAPHLTGRIESTLRAAEIEAAASASPTPHARQALIACRQSTRRVAIVTNNSEDAVRRYLTTHDLAENVEKIIGRAPGDPTLMKPNPYLVLKAIGTLGVDQDACALIGDSISDITAARAAHIRSIGYANKPEKYKRLMDAGAHAVIDTMSALATALLDDN
jgi:HAD superfamily hydrolase (TIGR01509 family)